MKVFKCDHVPGPDEEIRDFAYIAFGEGTARICVAVRDGKVEVRAWNGILVVKPRAANVVEVNAEQF